jgi:hypothetical protein
MQFQTGYTQSSLYKLGSERKYLEVLSGNKTLHPNEIKEKFKKIDFSNTLCGLGKSLKQHILHGGKVEDFIREQNNTLPENYEILGYNCQYSERKVNKNNHQIDGVKVRLELGFENESISVCGIINVEPLEEKDFIASQARVSFYKVPPEYLGTRLSVENAKTSDPNFLKFKFNETNLKSGTLPVFKDIHTEPYEYNFK